MSRSYNEIEPPILIKVELEHAKLGMVSAINKRFLDFTANIKTAVDRAFNEYNIQRELDEMANYLLRKECERVLQSLILDALQDVKETVRECVIKKLRTESKKKAKGK